MGGPRGIGATLGLVLAAVLGWSGAAGVAWGQAVIIIDPPTSDRPAPVLEVRQQQVEADIDGQVATTHLKQVFYNASGARLEGTLFVPLPAEAHIERFTMDIDGEPVEAELLDADKARQIYEDIVRRTRDPALLEYVGQGMLRCRVFPIEPHSEKRLDLTYTHLLPSDGGLVRYTHPLRGRTVQGRAMRPLSLRLEIETDAPLTTIYSPTHDVEVRRRGERRATVGYEAKDAGDRDFELFFGTQRDRDRVNLQLLPYRDGKDDPTGRDAGFFLLLASPSPLVARDEAMPKDIVFVLDTSGSMRGDKLTQAREALRFCLDNLNDDDRFDVVRFSTEVEPLFDGLRRASDANREEAAAFVEQFKPIGGTAIHDALTRALAIIETQREDENGDNQHRPRFVVFLTDGQPTIGTTDEDAIVKQVEADAEDTRVFCFGIGTDINTHLLDKITQTTRAASTYVLPDEDIELKVSRFYTKIDAPVLANLKLRTEGGVELEAMHPRDLPDLFHGEQLVVAGRYDGAGEASLVLEGTADGREVRYVHRVELPAETTEHAFIPPLWAMRRVGYLLDQIRLHGESDELRDEVVQLARAYGIVTPYTAYLIVEDEARRGVPLARQSLRTIGENRRLREEAQFSYDAMTTAKAGDDAVAGARSNQALRDAAAMSAPSMANAEALGRADGEAEPTGAGAQATRYVNGRTFIQNGAQWVDTQVQQQAEARVVRITFASDAYFDLLREHPDAAAWLAVGRSVQVVIDGQIYEIVEAG